MKFRTEVTVHRDGKIVYRTRGTNAARMCEARLASRKDKGNIELPSTGSPQDACINALAVFAEYKPARLCYGGHTPPSKARMTFAPCFFRADTGQTGAIRHVSLRQVG